MAGQPFYHLRPNKSIDRSLFLQTLIGLNRTLSIQDYNYTGFGSYLFDDFKALHDTLNIQKMISLERDPLEFQRAEYNVPYGGCITVLNETSTSYLAEFMEGEGEHNIFWLDFVSPSELGQQLSDYSTLLNQLGAYDVVRITLNANSDSLGRCEDGKQLHKYRLDKLKKRVPNAYLPTDISEFDITSRNYPLTLLKILKAATMEVLKDSPPYSPNYMLPLFSSIYADGQQMLTFTGIILDSHDKEEEIKNGLKNAPHNTFTWDKPCNIMVPALTVKEITEINKLLPNPEIRQQLIDKFPFIFSDKENIDVDSYIQYYRFYPRYHQVNF